MKTKDVLLGTAILFGLVLLAKAAQVSLTLEFWTWLETAGRALLESDSVRVLVIVAAFLFLLSLVAAGFDTAARRRERWEAERARQRALREESIRQSLADEFNEPQNRGPRAA